MTASGREIAVVGGGWAGLAAAIQATRQGHRVTLFEMARQLGGRAREVSVDGAVLDNGQHICIGAYRDTLRLLKVVGVAEHDAFLRTPLSLPYADGPGLALRSGPPALAFGAAVWRHPSWSAADKLRLLLTASRWVATGFRCPPTSTVAQLTASLPSAVLRDLIEPLCVAALNTPAETASAQVFLRVLRDALFSGRGSADLLLPRVSLGALLPAPAFAWLTAAGADVRLGHRVNALTPSGHDGWLVDGQPFDGVVLAASALEAARLVQPIAPAWADRARGLDYEPIVTVYLGSPGTVLAAPMLALRSGSDAPAQFVFDRGQLGGSDGLLAFVISGASRWVDRGTDATLAATRQQAETALGTALKAPLRTIQVVTEKRATFRCTPGLHRPSAAIAHRLVGAGDHVEGAYPSTLEGAVRSGIAAAVALSD